MVIVLAKIPMDDIKSMMKYLFRQFVGKISLDHKVKLNRTYSNSFFSKENMPLLKTLSNTNFSP